MQENKNTSKKLTERKQAHVADYAVLVRPIVTEKSAISGGAVFEVDARASKNDIRRAVEKVFQVKVQDVRTATYIGKPKRRGQSTGRSSGYKRAYVTLKDGERIEIIEGM